MYLKVGQSSRVIGEPRSSTCGCNVEVELVARIKQIITSQQVCVSYSLPKVARNYSRECPTGRGNGAAKDSRTIHVNLLAACIGISRLSIRRHHHRRHHHRRHDNDRRHLRSRRILPRSLRVGCLLHPLHRQTLRRQSLWLRTETPRETIRIAEIELQTAADRDQTFCWLGTPLPLRQQVVRACTAQLSMRGT